MPADREDLQKRLDAATPRDTVRGFVFGSVLSFLSERLGEEAARACDPAGSTSRVDFFSYPATDLLQLVWNGADRLEAQLGAPERAFFALGQRAVARLLESALGKTLLKLAAGSPRRLLSQVPASYRTTVSYGERTVEWLGERSCRIVYRRDLFPLEYNRGLLVAGLETTPARNPRVEGRRTGPLDLVFDVAWDE
ncbi:MAG TPA: DUF2378 family protein [Anaeromyxobacteraceae bacterium]|nr:DUF2378 family protein [Anaeromyxobacteraceae bacterium]